MERLGDPNDERLRKIAREHKKKSDERGGEVDLEFSWGNKKKDTKENEAKKDTKENEDGEDISRRDFLIKTAKGGAAVVLGATAAGSIAKYTSDRLEQHSIAKDEEAEAIKDTIQGRDTQAEVEKNLNEINEEGQKEQEDKYRDLR